MSACNELLYLTTGSVNAKGMVKLRRKHFDAGKVKELKTVEDILFSSSSAAADFVTGYSVSGQQTWKNKAGKTLKEIESERLGKSEA